MGLTGDRSALVIGDRATGYFDAIPLITKNMGDSEDALRHFAGLTKIKRAWTDCVAELIAACREMRIVHELATRERPQTNGRAERLVRKVMEGTLSLLMQAGMPPQFWPYAMRAYC